MSAPAQFSKPLWLFLGATLIVGCTPQADIRTYEIPASKNPPTTDRLRPMFARRNSAPAQLPDFKVPQPWSKARADQFSAAAFSAGPESDPVRITVTQTPAAMGIDVQLNRWRGQVQLDPLSADALQQQLEPMNMGDVQASFVQIPGSGRTIVGAIATVNDSMWFFKMVGSTESVAAELQRMREFCGSVRFKNSDSN